jgi:hypothetical protein
MEVVEVVLPFWRDLRKISPSMWDTRKRWSNIYNTKINRHCQKINHWPVILMLHKGFTMVNYASVGSITYDRNLQSWQLITKIRKVL